MTGYASYPNHPLANVPIEVLRVARCVLGVARDANLDDTDERNALADAVTQSLLEDGYLTWPTASSSSSSIDAR